MVYHYCSKRHIIFLLIEILTVSLVLLLILVVLSMLVLCAMGYPLSFLFTGALDVHSIDIISYFVFMPPALYALSKIFLFNKQRKYVKKSELHIEPNQLIPVEIVIQKNVYRICYHIHSISVVKSTYKGIAVYGDICAEYIYDSGVSKNECERLNRVIIPPYFSDMKSIVHKLRLLIS